MLSLHSNFYVTMQIHAKCSSAVALVVVIFVRLLRVQVPQASATIVRPSSSRSFVAPSHQDTGVRQLPHNIMHVNTHGLFCWARLPDEIESWRARAKLPTTMNTFGRSIMMMMAMGRNLHNMHGMSLGCGLRCLLARQLASTIYWP